ncbi:MAG: DUF4185 domain-containing protein [Aggregatilineales bacterium]
MRRQVVIGAFLTATVLVNGSFSLAQGTGKLPEVASVSDLGRISAPDTVTARDGGTSLLIGGKILWAFGDTLLSKAAVDGSNYRSNTAALADPSQPIQVSEPLDANGAPTAFIPFTADEQAYNVGTGRPDDRIALWPGAIISDSDGNGLVFFDKLKVKPGILNYEQIGVGLAHVAINTTTAVREPTVLFTVGEPLFTNAARFGDRVYVYGVIPDRTDQAVAVGRVTLSQATDRTAYQFWDGQDWVADVSAAIPVLAGVPGGMSVSYNSYLNHYLAVYSEILSSRVVMRLAPAPEGPWSDPIPLFNGLSAAKGAWDYAGLEHPELATNGGQTIVVSYYHLLGGFSGELRLVSITFK